MKRIGILTSGGDCQGLNASIRGVAKSLYEEFGNDVEIYGIKDGYKGLIFGEYKLMKPEDFSGILTLGGTILGTSRQPFKLMRVIDENSVDKVKNMKDNYKMMKLDCLVILGGHGTQKTASTAPWRSRRMSSTAFTPPPPPTAAFSAWRSWVTRSAGCRFMPASRAAQM